MIVKALRVGLGQLIVLGDALTRPRPQQRSAQGQAAVDREAAALSLYQFHACPFCVKTRRAIHRLNVPVALRDAKGDPQARAESQPASATAAHAARRARRAARVMARPGQATFA